MNLPSSRRLIDFAINLEHKENYLAKVGGRIVGLASTPTCLVDSIYHLAKSIMSGLNLEYACAKNGLNNPENVSIYTDAKNHFKIFFKSLALSPFAWAIGLYSPSLLNTILFEIGNTQDSIGVMEKDCINPIALKPLDQLHQELKMLLDDSKEPYYPKSSIAYNFDSLRGDFFDSSPVKPIVNFLPDYDRNSKTIFLPYNFLPSHANENFRPDTHLFNDLRNYLSIAFAVGKELVLARVCNDRHTALVAFRSDGQFKIIDSMSGNNIDKGALTKSLNRACIQDSQGKTIQFNGTYVNTCLQKGGYECMRFSFLYGYHMARKNSIEAYKEVNGAFAAGKLKTFEDIDKIDGSVEMEDASRVDRDNYKSFMRSWAYRSVNIPVDSWKDLPVKFLDLQLIPGREDEIYFIIDRSFIGSYSVYPLRGGKFALNDGSDPTVLTIPNVQEATLGSLIPEDGGQMIILPRKDNLPLIYKLSKGQEIDNSKCGLG